MAEATKSRRGRWAQAGLVLLSLLILMVALTGTAVVGLDRLSDDRREALHELVPQQVWSMAGHSDDEEESLIGPAYYANVHAVCGLLDSDELHLALGHPYHAGIEAPVDLPALFAMPGMVRCLYSSDLVGGRGGWVAVGVVYAYGEQVFDRALEYRDDRKIPAVEVDGLGDRAVWAGGDLLVLDDDKILGVHIAKHWTEDADRFEQTRRLAKRALERMR